MPLLIETDDALPVSLAELKSYLRIETSDDDTTLTHCLAAAVNYIEYETERDIVARTWSQSTTHPKRMVLERTPLDSVDSITDDIDYTIKDSQLANPVILFDNPTCKEITVAYTSGGISNPLIKQAVLWASVHFYMQREPEITGTIVSPLKMGLQRLITQLKMGGYA